MLLIISGIIIGTILPKLIKFEHKQFKVFGYTIIIEKDYREKTDPYPDVIPINKNQNECDFCHGEDLYINKSIMMCPKCKRNKSRVKSV